MKRYSLIVALVLIAGTSAWGYGLDSYNTSCYLPRCYTPGPCYQPPVCPPQPQTCYQPCYRPPVGTTVGTIVSNQNVTLTGPCSPGMGYATNCSGLMIYDQVGCRPPRIQCERYFGCDFEFGGFNRMP